MVVGVVLGALAAHALENSLTADQLDSFKTGVRYQIYHGLALLIFSQVTLLTDGAKNVIWVLFLAGTLLFSCSIYALSMQGISGIKLSLLGPVTPLGGLLLILGWVYGIVNLSRFNR